MKNMKKMMIIFIILITLELNENLIRLFELFDNNDERNI